MLRVAKGDARQRQHHGDLRDDDPAAPPPKPAAEEWRVIAVEKGRPEELELVGERQLAQQAKRSDRHLGLRQPSRLRPVDEQKGNARREPQAQRRRDAAVGE